jgi:hypothetical protein
MGTADFTTTNGGTAPPQIADGAITASADFTTTNGGTAPPQIGDGAITAPADFTTTNGGTTPGMQWSGNLVPGSVGQGYVYRMRARDTTLATIVYWNSYEIDAGGLDYTGPGPLTAVVVSNILPL